jgi:hypothetical protein
MYIESIRGRCLKLSALLYNIKSSFMSIKKSSHDFLIANKNKMTASEAAKELGVVVPAVTLMCQRLGIQMMSIRERKISFIKENPDMSVEDIAKFFDCSEGSIRNIISNNHLRKKSTSIDAVRLFRKIKEMEKKKKEEQTGIIEEVEEEYKGRSADVQVKTYDQRKKEREEYKKTISSELTQGGSPYGFADNLRGIKLKQ